MFGIFIGLSKWKLSKAIRARRLSNHTKWNVWEEIQDKIQIREYRLALTKVKCVGTTNAHFVWVISEKMPEAYL